MINNIKELVRNNKILRPIWKMHRYAQLKRIDKPLIKEVDADEIKKLKGTKKGKRCFIVGNGPSLSIEDLNKIKCEDSFAVNRIYKIFDKTEWRPTFYCSQDTRVLDEISEDIGGFVDACEEVFLNVNCEISENIKAKSNVHKFWVAIMPYENDLPDFSMKPYERVYEGYTVAYACIQLAVFMGYSEIYIIGTDHSYSVNKLNDGTIVENSDIKNYMLGLEGKVCYPPQMEKSTLAFRKARKVCDQKGIIIRNATRGGHLEEFERVDFDSLF